MIQFDTYAQQLTPLLRNSKQYNSHLKQTIDNITIGSDNNLNDAMKIAFQVMKKRKTFNPITSIFILTDGV